MATVSSRVATAEKDDIDRAFDKIVCLDETYTNIGIHHGRIEAIQRREQEGYRSGEAMGHELGFYYGCIVKIRNRIENNEKIIERKKIASFTKEAEERYGRAAERIVLVFTYRRSNISHTVPTYNRVMKSIRKLYDALSAKERFFDLEPDKLRQKLQLVRVKIRTLESRLGVPAGFFSPNSDDERPRPSDDTTKNKMKALPKVDF